MAAWPAEIRDALTDLVNKLEVCHADARYQSVWTTAHFRLGAYSGPTYTEELKRAKELLAEKEMG